MTFVHPELDLEVAVHGDVFVAEGVKQSLDAFDAIMERFFNVRSLPRIGPPECGGETSAGDHLNCIISWTRAGFTCEGNPKHIGDLFHLLGFGENTEGVEASTHHR